VKQKDWLWNNDYNLVNGVHSHGQRYNPYGPQNYPDEVRKTREMMTLRDHLIHDLAPAQKPSPRWTTAPPTSCAPVPTNFDPQGFSKGKMGSIEYKNVEQRSPASPWPRVTRSTCSPPSPSSPTSRIRCSSVFDNKGRLWVAVMPSYPHYKPGDPPERQD
jgi:hypothetical protein